MKIVSLLVMREVGREMFSDKEYTQRAVDFGYLALRNTGVDAVPEELFLLYLKDLDGKFVRKGQEVHIEQISTLSRKSRR